MAGVRRLGRFTAILVTAVVALIPASSSRAVEAFDGRFQLHGFYENQTRVIARNFSGNDDWDLTQWYQVLNLEMEFDIAPDGWGPFDILSAYARVEARFDCVYDRACHVFPSVNTYGDRTRHLPKRLSDSRRTGFTGAQFTGHVRKRHGIPSNRLGFEFGVPPQGPIIYNDRLPMRMWNVPGIDTLFGVDGPDQIEGTPDDPAPYVLERFLDFEFASRKVRGSANGVGTQLLGPWLPKNFVDPIGALSDRANPFDASDFNPVLIDVSGGFCGPNDAACTARPFRPAPQIPAGTNPVDQQFARGIYYPNIGLADLIRDDNLDNFDQNFREAELKWNRGASQQQTHFLKEAYVDIELFDSSLWLRLGKQSIVWGKTELFRTTDQFNPQDLALATLPSLEESRIALWAARAVYSLWSVGPLEDVRVEFAANIDHFEGADFGQCGEPYTVNAACNLRAGLFAHGISGFGLAGATKPEDPWEDIKGLEVGFRVEFRWDRFSFALTDFYGYDDFPFADQIFRYERNVDPYTGRLRVANTREACDPDGVRPASAGGVGVTTGCLDPSEALRYHHANQQLFAFICSTSIGFTTLDPTVCAQSVFGSSALPLVIQPNVAAIIGSSVTGDAAGIGVGASVLGALGAAVPPNDIPLVDLGLGYDPDGNGVPDDPVNSGFCPACFLLPTATSLPTLRDHLSDEQQALFGCGPLLGTDCETDGIDLLNAEASALTSAWITSPVARANGITATNQPGQPGTVGAVAQYGRFWCQRFIKGTGLVVLPGCRAPGDPFYRPEVDGIPGGIRWFGPGPDNDAGDGGGAGNDADNGTDAATSAAIAAITNCQNAGDNGIGFCDVGHPFTGELFNSTMDAASWNFQMLLVVFSAIGATGRINDFDATQPLRTNGCSWLAPQYCSNVQAFLSIIGQRRNSILAGGNRNYGRPDFVWHGGTSNRLKWKKRNVLGFAMDFAEDVTKTNWSVETTWIHNLVVADNDALDGVAEIDQFNLTVSVDRPTFVNFLNQGRTIFINSQWFFRYEDGFNQSMPRNGPFNVLFTLTAFTGFYQDRLNPSITHVYDFMSESGAVLPSINYRYNESFSVEFGMALFYGKWQSTRMALNPISLGNNVGSGAYREFSERGLALVRDRDEVFVRLRKTF
jgi:hypothetical protein